MRKKIQIAVIEIGNSPAQALLLKTAPRPDSFWQNVTGSVDKADGQSTASQEEIFLNAAKRELWEETGIEGGEIINLNYPLIYFSKRWQKEIHEECFLCLLKNKPQITLSKEHQEHKWRSINDFSPQWFHYPSNAEVMKLAIDRALKLLSIVVLFLISHHQALAVDNLDDLDKLDQMIDEVEQIKTITPSEWQELKTGHHQKVDEELKEYDLHRQRRPTPREIPEAAKPRWVPAPFRAALAKGSTLIERKSKKSIVTPTILYIWAEEKVVGGEIVYIYDKKGELRYETLAKNVSSIERDLDLGAHPDRYQIEQPPVIHQVLDKKLKLQHQFSWSAQSIHDPFSAQIFKSYIPSLQDGDLSATSNSLNYKIFFPWEFPIDVGMALTYNTGYWKDDAQGAKWSALYLGPSFQYLHEQNEFWGWRAQLTIQTALSHSINYDGQPMGVDYSVAQAQVGGDLLYRSSIGVWSLGPSYTVIRSSLKNSTRSVQISSEKKNATAWAINLGYTFEHDI